MATASLLHTKLNLLGYTVFFNIEEMPPGEWEKHLYAYIDGARDIIVVIEKGSLDGWKKYNKNGEKDESYKDDWFYKEVAYAFKHNKNIIPIWNNYNIPDSLDNDFPPEVALLKKLQSPAFSLLHIESSIDKLTSKGFLKSVSKNPQKGRSTFKLYTNQKCCVYNGKNLVAKVDANADDPFYWHVERKGEYRLRCVPEKGKCIILDCTIGTDEEKIIDIKFKSINIPKRVFIYGLGTVFLFSLIINIFILSTRDVPSVDSGVFSSNLKEFNRFDTRNKAVENRLNSFVNNDVERENIDR